MKILFLATYPRNDATTRYRICQFLPFLAAQGMVSHVDTIMPAGLYRIKNRSGIRWTVLKALWLCLCLIRRLVTLPRVLFYDTVVVQREAFPFFTPLVEWCVRRLAQRMVFDFDDAVYASPQTWKNWRDVLRNPSNVQHVCRYADTVIVGGASLREYAGQYSTCVEVLPTVYRVDGPLGRRETNGVPVIGWIGSWSTLVNLDLVVDVFEALASQRHYLLRLVGAENIRAYRLHGVEIEYVGWTLETELESLRSFDIGVMPLYDNVWERGKCGFKLIQYMSVGLPVVGSNVGANRDIICHGRSGFLASTSEEWLQALARLLDDKSLRRTFGEAGLEIVRESFSYEKNAVRLAEILKGTVSGDHTR